MGPPPSGPARAHLAHEFLAGEPDVPGLLDHVDPGHHPGQRLKALVGHPSRCNRSSSSSATSVAAHIDGPVGANKRNTLPSRCTSGCG